MVKKILFVGFENLASDYASVCSHFSAICNKFGCKAVFPVENNQPRDNFGKFDTPLEESKAAFRVNLHRIDFADVVVANLDYFGVNGFCSNDSAFEIGYAASKNKRIIGFVDAEHTSGVDKHHNAHSSALHASDKKKPSGRPISHMVASATSAIIRGGIEDCLELVLSGSTFHEGECKIYTINRHT